MYDVGGANINISPVKFELPSAIWVLSVMTRSSTSEINDAKRAPLPSSEDFRVHPRVDLFKNGLNPAPSTEQLRYYLRQRLFTGDFLFSKVKNL